MSTMARGSEQKPGSPPVPKVWTARERNEDGTQYVLLLEQDAQGHIREVAATPVGDTTGPEAAPPAAPPHGAATG